MFRFGILHIILVLGFALNTTPVLAQDTTHVKVMGTGADARFEPTLALINSGDVLVFTVVEGMHTVTAYHPDNRRPDRIPNGAKSFDSGILEKGDQWSLRLYKNGMYDYFCLPHERMGHVGRVMVGQSMNEAEDTYPQNLLPAKAQEVFNTLNDNTTHNQ